MSSWLSAVVDGHYGIVGDLTRTLTRERQRSLGHGERNTSTSAKAATVNKPKAAFRSLVPASCQLRDEIIPAIKSAKISHLTGLLHPFTDGHLRSP
jgi:hypothetical protein